MSSIKSRACRLISPFANVSCEVQVLEVRRLLSSIPASSPVITPTIDVLTPPTFREGDVFTVTVMDAAPGKWAGIDVVGDNDTSQCHFPSVQIDSYGNATFALRMPYVLAKGYSVDGRTLRVTAGLYTQDFHVTLHEGQRVGLSTDNVQEGKSLTVTIKNGVGNSQTIIQLTKDNAVVQEWENMSTDGSGNGTYKLTIPTVLSGGSRVDGFGLRVIHGGVVTDQKITITEGFRVELGAKKVRETVSNFPMGVLNSTPNATVTLTWYLDDAKRATQTFRTDSKGDGNFTVPTPKLITNSAGEDTFCVVVTVNGQSSTFTFKMLVLKYTPANKSSPASGGSQALAEASTANKTNSAPGVSFNTPTALGVKNVRSIPKAENNTLGVEDPAVTILDHMKHQLVILCYGSDQQPGQVGADGIGPGMDQVYSDIQGVTGRSHVMQLWSGNKSSDLDNNPRNADATDAAKATAAAKQSITERMKLLNSLGQRIDSVVLAGYSWGGGMALELANWITGTYHIEISGLVYVDAVNHGLAGHQTALPDVRPSSFLNIYESNHSALEKVYLEGNGHIANWGLAGFDGTAYYGRYREIDTDASGVNVTDHANVKGGKGAIDNKEASVVATFINGVLNDWYGAHHS